MNVILNTLSGSIPLLRFTRSACRALPSRLLTLSLAAALASGCSYLSPTKTRLQNNLAEESRALTSAVVDTLQNQPATMRDPYSTTALLFAKQDQHIEGLPLQPFDVSALLAAAAVSNLNIAPERQLAATRDLQQRFARQNASLAKLRKVEEQLLSRGVQAEQEQNNRIKRWLRRFALLGFPLAALITLCILMPAALPIIGRLLAWIVGKLPRLAGYLGIVSVKAFDAVVTGVERGKSALSQRHSSGQSPAPGHATSDAHQFPHPHPVTPTAPVRLQNDASTHGGSRRHSTPDPVTLLHDQLSKTLDQSHKQLVLSRKKAITPPAQPA